MITKRTLKRGFTLIELMIVVAIIGVLAALAIYGVRRYITNAKTAEARTAIGRIAKDAASAYAREGMAAATLAVQNSTGVLNRLCDDANAVPSSAGSIAGRKYQSSPAEWDGSAAAGWQCLRFSMTDPQYYQYDYNSSSTAGADGDTFTAVANGDLNGDSTLSTFTLLGEIDEDSAGGGLFVKIAPNIGEVAPDE